MPWSVLLNALGLSNVVSQHQFFGVRVQIYLVEQIGNVVLVHMMSDQGDGNDQRNQFVPVVFDIR